MMKVPYVALDRAFNRNRDRYMKVAEEVWSSGKLHDGKYVEQLEATIAGRCNREYGVAVASCTDALYFSLLANNIDNYGDEVIVTSYSFIASVSCIRRAGACPIFMDIDPDTYMINPDDIEKYITPKTKAILAVNLFGQALPIEYIEIIAKRNNLILIEDAAQSFGAFNFDRPVGSMGEASCISFDPVKNIGSYGTGGIIVTDSSSVFLNAQSYRNHGKSFGSDEHFLTGIKSKLPEVDAAMLLVSLDDFDKNNIRRADIAGMYINGLMDVDEITLPIIDNSSIWHKFVILVGLDKKGLMQHLRDNGVESKNVYPRPLYWENDNRAEHTDICVHAELITMQNIALPIFPDMTNEEVEYVISTIKKFYQ